MSMASFLFSPRGRVGRTAFFGYHALILLIMLILGIGLSFIPVNLQIGVNIVWLLLLYPSFCLSAKRLHDVGHSMRLLWLFVPEILAAVIAQLGIGFTGGLIAGVFNMIAILSHITGWGLILYLTLKRGDEGDNAYGAATAPSVA